MGIVRVSPELHLIFDPIGGTISEEREDVIQYTLDPVISKLQELDKVANDLMGSLTPDTQLLTSYPGREKTSYIAGIYTNIWYGFVIGLIVAFLALLGMGGV